MNAMSIGNAAVFIKNITAMMIRDLEEAVNHGVAAIFPDAE